MKLALTLAATLLASSATFAAQQHGGHSGHGGHTTKASPARKQTRQTPAKKRRAERTVIGYISDSHCGLKHMEGMGDDAACTLKCVEGGGKFVLADRARNVVYELVGDSQEKARGFAGKKVKVTGHVDGKTIHATKIEAAS